MKSACYTHLFDGFYTFWCPHCRKESSTRRENGQEGFYGIETSCDKCCGDVVLRFNVLDPDMGINKFLLERAEMFEQMRHISVGEY